MEDIGLDSPSINFISRSFPANFNRKSRFQGLARNQNKVTNDVPIIVVDHNIANRRPSKWPRQIIPGRFLSFRQQVVRNCVPGSCCIALESAKRIESFLLSLFHEFVIVVVYCRVWVYGLFKHFLHCRNPSRSLSSAAPELHILKLFSTFPNFPSEITTLAGTHINSSLNTSENWSPRKISTWIQ